MLALKKPLRYNERVVIIGEFGPPTLKASVRQGRNITNIILNFI